MKKLLLCFISILFIISCSTNSTNEFERTFPEAFDFERSSVQEIRNKVSPPDSLNADAYVLSVIKCSPQSSCILPDGIIISDSPEADTPDKGLMLVLSDPQQFKEGQYYRLSLDISTSPDNGKKRFELLGYSQLNKSQSQ